MVGRELRLHIGIRICDRIGRRLDRAGMRLFGDRWIGACVVLHDTSAPKSDLIVDAEAIDGPPEYQAG